MKQQAADAGVEIIGLHWLLAKTDGFYLTSPDSEVRRRTAGVSRRRWPRRAAISAATVMVFGSPKQRSLLPGVSTEQAYDLAAETFRRAMPALADLGVTLCMEPLSPAETDFVNTCDDALRLAETGRTSRLRAAPRRQGDVQRADRRRSI